MAKRSRGLGILPFVILFLGLLAAGATFGLFHFYGLYDTFLKEEKPKLQGDVEKAQKATRAAEEWWNNVAPWIFDDMEKFKKPTEFTAFEGQQLVRTQIVEPVLDHLGRDEHRGLEYEQRVQFALRDRLKYGQIVKKLDADVASLAKQLEEARGACDKLQKDLKAQIEAAGREQEELQKRIRGVTDELGETGRRLEASHREKDTQQAEAKSKLEAEQRARVKELQDRQRKIDDLQNETLRLQEKIREITTVKAERESVILEPDGEITGVAPALGIAYINLGRHQRVQRGMRFTVYAVGRGGLPHVKGKIEIRNVEADTSKVGVLSEVDRRDPIVEGDQIANVVYRQDDTPVFVLCGEMEKFNREDMIRLIEENGGKVAPRVSPETDFVVVAGDVSRYQGDSRSNYQEALQLALRIMSEKEMLSFLPHFGGGE